MIGVLIMRVNYVIKPTFVTGTVKIIVILQLKIFPAFFALFFVFVLVNQKWQGQIFAEGQ